MGRSADITKDGCIWRKLGDDLGCWGSVTDLFTFMGIFLRYFIRYSKQAGVY